MTNLDKALSYSNLKAIYLIFSITGYYVSLENVSFLDTGKFRK